MVKQITLPNKNEASAGGLISFKKDFPDTVEFWSRAYFQFEVTTSLTSQKEQKRDIEYFIRFMRVAEKNTARINWSPRLSKAFVEYLKRETLQCNVSTGQGRSQAGARLPDGQAWERGGNGKRRFSDRTINRMVAHLKTFSKWIHKLRPFPLGNPMEKIKGLAVGSDLDVERAITPAERRKILDAADLLLQIGGLSKDRNRFRKQERPKRKRYRPFRNRAIVYTLIETGMRRAAVARLRVEDVDFMKGVIRTEEKGGVQHTYRISKEGLGAIGDYLNEERGEDFFEIETRETRETRQCLVSTRLFLPAASVVQGTGRLSVQAINSIWNEICERAGVQGKTPHSARHAMGKHIIEKTGNIAAVQKQLGHRNAAYSMQYARITGEELSGVINDRG